MGKILLITSAAMISTAATVFAQMGSGQDGHMSGTGHGWGMGYGWITGIILLLIVVLGAVYIIKKK